MGRIDQHNVTRYWWDRHVPGLSLMQAEFTTHEYPPHVHEALVVAVTETGGAAIKSRGSVEQAHASALFVFNPVEPHAGWMGASDYWRYRSLYLTRLALDEIARGLGIGTIPYFTRNMFFDPDLIRDFLKLHRAVEAGRDVFLERELLISSFGRLFHRHGSWERRIDIGPHDRRLLSRASEMMQDRFAEGLRLQDVAAEVGLTQFQLIGLYKRTLGLTPHAYLTQVRLNHACRLLAHGSPLAEAAIDSGFYDQSAMHRHFRRCYAMTPRQFAAAALEARQSRRA